jgi:excisionase family DNA binding protein
MSTDQDGFYEKKVDASQWISQTEAAKLRGVSRQAIARLVQKGRFKTLSIGGKTLLRRSEVEEFRPKPPGPSPKSKRLKGR